MHTPKRIHTCTKSRGESLVTARRVKSRETLHASLRRRRIKLYEIAEAIELAFLSHTDQETGEIDEAVWDVIEELDIARKDKILACKKFAEGEQSEADAVRAVAAKQTARARVHEARAKRITQYALEHMQKDLDDKWEKIKDDEMRLRVGQVESVVIYDVTKVAGAGMYRKAPEEKDFSKTAIKKSLKAGIEVPGAKLATSRFLVSY